MPLVPSAAIPARLQSIKGVPIVALTLSPDRLLEIRRNRLRRLNEKRESSYVDADAVRQEVVEARRSKRRRASALRNEAASIRRRSAMP